MWFRQREGRAATKEPKGRCAVMKSCCPRAVKLEQENGDRGAWHASSSDLECTGGPCYAASGIKERINFGGK